MFGRRKSERNKNSSKKIGEKMEKYEFGRRENMRERNKTYEVAPSTSFSSI